MSRSLFDFHLTCFVPVKANVIAAVLVQVARERRGELTDQPSMRAAIEILLTMGNVSVRKKIDQLK